MEVKICPYQSRLVASGKTIEYFREKTKYKVEGYQYTDAYEKWGWNGDVYPIDRRGFMPTGLVMYVVRKLSKAQSEYKLTGNPIRLPWPAELSYEVGNGWTLDDRQQNVLRTIAEYAYPNGDVCTHGVIEAGVGFGKTAVFASIIRNLPNQNFLILCTSSAVYKQTVKFFFDIYGEEGVGIIQGKNTILKRVTVGMLQTLRNRKDKKIADFFDVLIGDECHGLSNDSGKKVLSFLKTPFRYFFSATPYDHGRAGSKMDILGLCGYPIVKISSIDNQQKGRTLKAKVYIHRITYPPMINYDYLLYLQYNASRNRKIAEIVAANPLKKILIVVKFAEHGKEILKYCPDVLFTHGQDSDRSRTLQKFVEDPVGKLITTFIIKEGVNIPDIQLMILAFGGKDKISIKQVAGRGVRRDGVYDKIEIHDFYDEVPGLEEHSKERIKIYKQEGYIIHENQSNRRSTIVNG